MNRRRIRTIAVQVGLHLLLGLGAVLMLGPFTLMTLAAFSPEDRVDAADFSLGALTLANFRTTLAEVDWLQLYRNSSIVTATILVIQILIGLPAGYVLARSRFRLKALLRWLVLTCLIIPPQVTAIPLFLAISRAGFADSLPGLITPFVVSAFGIFLFRQFILTIPASIFDAARMDGVGHFAVIWRIVLPNAWPAVVAFSTFSVIAHWNDLFWPSVVVRTTDAATVPYGIVRYSGSDTGAQYSVQMAAALLAVAPLILAFLLAQRHYVRGIALRMNAD
ncbi:carbohydrate ABC transporter permease [Nocardia sp. NPDC004711]